MTTIIIIGATLVNVGVPEFKEELKMGGEQPLFKRVFIYIITLLDF